MKKIITYTFPKCWVHIDEQATFLTNAFDDGEKLYSVPNPEKDYKTALKYGYETDIWSMWRHHDVLHHTIGTLFGHGVSPTIWSVVHPDHPNALSLEARLAEERFIGHIHLWINKNLWHDELGILNQFGPSLREELTSILKGEILDINQFYSKRARS